MHKCIGCGRELTDSEFRYCGIDIGTKTVFFDYSCNQCSHIGRWLIADHVFHTHTEALSFLIRSIDPDGKMIVPQRENAQDFLKNVHGVDDFLRLGGENAPREPAR
jgi:hypothetical protein